MTENKKGQIKKNKRKKERERERKRENLAGNPRPPFFLCYHFFTTVCTWLIPSCGVVTHASPHIQPICMNIYTETRMTTVDKGHRCDGSMQGICCPGYARLSCLPPLLSGHAARQGLAPAKASTKKVRYRKLTDCDTKKQQTYAFLIRNSFKQGVVV